jgi:hypothetical protein
MRFLPPNSSGNSVHLRSLFPQESGANENGSGSYFASVCSGHPPHNRHHSVDQQLCRWLLLPLDRLSSNQLTMAQELIADMLGVRSEGVTEVENEVSSFPIISARFHIKCYWSW